MISLTFNMLGGVDWLGKTVNYEIVKGNSIWRFGAVMLIILVTMVVGRLAQYFIEDFSRRKIKKSGDGAAALFFNCLSKPVSVFVFAIGLFACRHFLVFDAADTDVIEGISSVIGRGWFQVAKAVMAIAVTYAIYRLVDIVEYYLIHLTSKTKTKLDDMLVPVVRKSLRITIAIVASLWIADGILGFQVRAILLSAGVGGIAIALAAKDTIANFFGSITIFTDTPFQIDELVRIGEHYGPVEEVGFRSTKIRTLQGHLVTIPNSMIANSPVENVSKRPFIRRTSNITITYDSSYTKAEKAVEIIKEILADVPEVNVDPEKRPRVYFADFSDWALVIYMSYWVKPADYWLYHEVNEKINIEMMKRFEAEKIEFAFPTQTVHLKKD